MSSTITPMRSFPPSAGTEEEVHSETPEPDAGARRVLFIDDNAEVRDICAELLRRAGFQVDLASDGEAGWEMLSAQPYDLLITDHNMPRLSGIELVRRLRVTSPGLPVILVSGNVPWEEPDLQWMLRPGLVLQKPFSFAELLSRVAELLHASGDAEHEHEHENPAAKPGSSSSNATRSAFFDFAAH